MTGGRRQHPDEQQQQRKAHELNPARDLNPRRQSGRSAHTGDRTSGPASPSLRPPVWDWSFVEDGALALEPARELNRRRESGTVRQMSAPAPGRAARSRHHRQHHDARRRRLAVVVAIALVAVGTLLVTAFGGGDHPTATQPAPASASRLLPAGPPTLEVIARIDGLHLALPINQSRVTAIGYHGASDGALGLTPIGTQANEGLLKRLLHKIVGGGSGHRAGTSSPGARDRRPRRSTSEPRPEPMSMHRSAARSSGSGS